MENTQNKEKRVPENFSLDEFARVYVEKALELAVAELPFPYFDEHLRTRVANALDIPAELVVALHHPFHWMFFNRLSVFDYRPAEAPPKITEDARKILAETGLWTENFLNPIAALRRQYNPEDAKHLTAKVLGEFGDLLQNKLESYARTCDRAA